MKFVFWKAVNQVEFQNWFSLNYFTSNPFCVAKMTHQEFSSMFTHSKRAEQFPSLTNLQLEFPIQQKVSIWQMH